MISLIKSIITFFNIAGVYILWHPLHYPTLCVISWKKTKIRDIYWLW